MELPSLISSLSLIEDQHSNKNKRYPLLLLIVFCASIFKQDSWYTMQDYYAQAHEASLREHYKQRFGGKLAHVTPPTTRSIEPCK